MRVPMERDDKMKVVKTEDKDRVIELRMEGKRVVIGELRRNAPMYDNSIALSVRSAEKLVNALASFLKEHGADESI